MWQTKTYNPSVPEIVWSESKKIKRDGQNLDDFITCRLASAVLEERGDELDAETRDHLENVVDELS